MSIIHWFHLDFTAVSFAKVQPHFFPHIRTNRMVSNGFAENVMNLHYNKQKLGRHSEVRSPLGPPAFLVIQISLKIARALGKHVINWRNHTHLILSKGKIIGSFR